MTCRDMRRHDIAQNDIASHYVGLEEKEIWAGNINACECFHHFLYVLCYKPGVVTNTVYLTNRSHVAVRLFSNRSKMTSKCGKNKKVAHKAIAECVTDVLTTF